MTKDERIVNAFESITPDEAAKERMLANILAQVEAEEAVPEAVVVPIAPRAAATKRRARKTVFRRRIAAAACVVLLAGVALFAVNAYSPMQARDTAPQSSAGQTSVAEGNKAVSSESMALEERASSEAEAPAVKPLAAQTMECELGRFAPAADAVVVKNPSNLGEYLCEGTMNGEPGKVYAANGAEPQSAVFFATPDGYVLCERAEQ